MVEVVQDFLRYVQSGFDVQGTEVASGRHNVNDSATVVLSENAADPLHSRASGKLSDLLFNEVLDLPFTSERGTLQLKQFVLKCERVMPQIDMQLVEIQNLVLLQPHSKSKEFTNLLKSVTDKLYQALELMRDELSEVWMISTSPIFYPDEFLDLSDMFITSKLVVRGIMDVLEVYIALAKSNHLQVPAEYDATTRVAGKSGESCGDEVDASVGRPRQERSGRSSCHDAVGLTRSDSSSRNSFSKPFDSIW